MRTNLALLNILSNLPKTVLSIAGIGVAIVLIFMQLGFRGAVEDTATNIYGKLDFDILIRSPDYLHFIDSGTIEQRLLDEIAGLDGVQDVKSLRVAVANWRTERGEMQGILLLGVDPDQSPFHDQDIDRHFNLLNSADTLLIDRKSHREFGPLNRRKFDSADVGRSFEVADRQMNIVGLFSMGAGLAANGAAIVSETTFERLVPQQTVQQVSFGLVQLQDGVDAEVISQTIRGRFQRSTTDQTVGVLTREEVIRLELKRWIGETPIGFIFTLGVMIALLVGAAIVYMVLGNDVAYRLNEYATLRAMGYSNLYLSAMVLKQSAYLALFSFVPALMLSLGLYWVTSVVANIAMEMNFLRVGSVFVLTVVMCGLSGALALKKLWQAAPADLF